MTTKIEDIVDCYPKPKACKNCGSEVIITSNAKIYSKEFGNGKCYKCVSCDSYVGVHGGTNIPLGILANKEERELKKKCHESFDKLWFTPRQRNICYKELSILLKIKPNQCHFGWFELEMLQKAYDKVQKMYRRRMALNLYNIRDVYGKK
jgi:hypothetical protein